MVFAKIFLAGQNISLVGKLQTNANVCLSSLSSSCS